MEENLDCRMAQRPQKRLDAWEQEERVRGADPAFRLLLLHDNMWLDGRGGVVQHWDLILCTWMRDAGGGRPPPCHSARRVLTLITL